MRNHDKVKYIRKEKIWNDEETFRVVCASWNGEGGVGLNLKASRVWSVALRGAWNFWNSCKRWKGAGEKRYKFSGTDFHQIFFLSPSRSSLSYSRMSENREIWWSCQGGLFWLFGDDLKYLSTFFFYLHAIVSPTWSTFRVTRLTDLGSLPLKR